MRRYPLEQHLQSVKYIYAALYLFSRLLPKSRKKQSTDLKRNEMLTHSLLNTNLNMLTKFIFFSIKQALTG